MIVSVNTWLTVSRDLEFRVHRWKDEEEIQYIESSRGRGLNVLK